MCAAIQIVKQNSINRMVLQNAPLDYSRVKPSGPASITDRSPELPTVRRNPAGQPSSHRSHWAWQLGPCFPFVSSKTVAGHATAAQSTSSVRAVVMNASQQWPATNTR